MKRVITLIYYIKSIPINIKKTIFQILAIKIVETNNHGKTLIGDYGWDPLLLTYVEKEGYHVINDLFQYEYPGCFEGRKRSESPATVWDSNPIRGSIDIIIIFNLKIIQTYNSIFPEFVFDIKKS